MYSEFNYYLKFRITCDFLLFNDMNCIKGGAEGLMFEHVIESLKLKRMNYF